MTGEFIMNGQTKAANCFSPFENLVIFADYTKEGLKMEWIKTEDQKPENNEEVLTYHIDHKDWAVMTYEESVDGDYYSFVEDGEIYYPEYWARLIAPTINPAVMKSTRSG